MSGFLLTAKSAVKCSHNGTATPVATNSRVLVGGEPTLLVPAAYGIAGCSLTNSTGAPFCMTGMWSKATARVTSNGMPLAVEGVGSTCVNTSQPMRVDSNQRKVSAQ